MRSLTFWILTATLLNLHSASDARGQECTAGPKCTAAGQKSEDYNATMRQRLSETSGTANAATMNYCVMMVGAEVSRVCADEQRELGKASCAKLADLQAEAFKKNAKASEQIVMQTSQGPWQRICGW